MPLRHPTADELARWDELVGTNPGGSSFWQFKDYATFKQPHWKPVYAVHELSDGTTCYALYIERRVPGFGPYWYCSAGPRVHTQAQFREVCEQLRGLKSPFVVFMEPSVVVASDAESDVLAGSVSGLVRKSPYQRIGLNTVAVDLTPDEDALMASFKQRTRRYIRKNASATIDIVTDDSCFDDFWRLYCAMLDRSKVNVNPREYYEQFWRFYLERGQGFFIFATADGESETGAGAFVMLHEDLGLYKDGGSVRGKDVNGLQYRLQWEAMRYCKQRGAKVYDLFGAPPSWRADDETHGLHGLVQFKTGFAPITDYAGAFQLNCREPQAKLWEQIGNRAYTTALWKLRHQYFV